MSSTVTLVFVALAIIHVAGTGRLRAIWDAAFSA